jgi:hypothetical protein
MGTSPFLKAFSIAYIYFVIMRINKIVCLRH